MGLPEIEKFLTHPASRRRKYRRLIPEPGSLRPPLPLPGTA